jgi:hypothetical protein
MRFMRNISPVGALADFRAVWNNNPYRWPVLALAILTTTGILSVFIPKSERIPEAKPKITYVSTFEEGRSDEEIRAANIENQKKLDELATWEAEQEEARKEIYRTLGRMSGMDVDKMERDIKEQEAAEKAANDAAAKKAEAQPVAADE